MNRKKCAMCVLCLMTAVLFAETADSVVLSYRRNFIRASLLTKLELITDASGISNVDMTPLYNDAIDFVLQNCNILGSDGNLIDLATVAVVQIGKSGAETKVAQLWKLFSVYNTPKLQCAILDALSVLAKNNPELISDITQYAARQVSLLEAGTVVDSQVFSAVVTTLGEVGTADAFNVLFRAAMGSVDQPYRDMAFSALVNLKFDFKASILSLLDSGSESEKTNVFNLAMRYPTMDDLVRGEIAEHALRIALNITDAQKENGYLSDLRFSAIPYLTKLNWVQASALAVEHFYLAQTAFRKGQVPLDRFIESIQCLGAMGTAEAAQSLAIYLSLINSEMEQTKTYNEQVVLAVIAALSRLGDKSAFDYLLYVGYLEYPESVKKASRDALAGLKW